jgi:hypothetical protein
MVTLFPSLASLASLAYLIVFGAIIAYSSCSVRISSLSYMSYS